jgi:DNA/RNA endonuclease YhcR with UshA esterase domain
LVLHSNENNGECRKAEEQYTTLKQKKDQGGLMNKVLFLFIIVFLVSGCEIPQNTEMKTAEDSKALVEESVTTTEESTVAPEVAPEEEKIEVDSNQVKVEATVLAKEEEIPISRTAEETINENRWGFSIYDPQTGIIEYYGSKGGYLGKKTLQ